MAAEARWYIIHTYSGYENKVAENIGKIVENRKMHDKILGVCIPVEKVVEIRDDKTIEVERKIFPSYVLIKLTMNDESWHAVRNITGVTGFVGPGSRPTPLSEAEVEALNIEEKKVKLSYAVGDSVKVIAGLFEGYTGTVQSISDDMKTATVLVKRGNRDQ